MRRIVIAFLALAATATAAFAQFAAFEKTQFEALVKSNAPVVLHAHEWW